MAPFCKPAHQLEVAFVAAGGGAVVQKEPEYVHAVPPGTVAPRAPLIKATGSPMLGR